MQQYKVENQKSKNCEHQSHDPRHYNPQQLRAIHKIDREASQSHMYDHNKSISKGGEDAGKKKAVVSLPNAVIEPHAVMVEIVHASVAISAVFAAHPTVALTELAEQDLVVFRRKDDLPIVAGPHVVVHYPICWVVERCQGCSHEHRGSKQQVQDQESCGEVEREGRGEVNGDGCGYDEIRCYLRRRRTMRKPMSGMLAEIVIGGWAIKSFDFLLHQFTNNKKPALNDCQQMRLRSNGESPLVHLPLDELVELFPRDGLSPESANRMDDLYQLLVTVAVFQLLADVAQVVEVQLALAFDVQQGEVGPSSLFVEWTALGQEQCTILLVSSLRKPSKSKAAPWVESWISWSSLKTNSYFWSSPRVLAVMRKSLTSALLCLGSAQSEKRACSSAMPSGENTAFLEPMSLASTVFNSFSWISFFDIYRYNARQQIIIQLAVCPLFIRSPPRFLFLFGGPKVVGQEIGAGNWGRKLGEELGQGRIEGVFGDGLLVVE